MENYPFLSEPRYDCFVNANHGIDEHVMEHRKERLAKNEVAFREVNEGIRAAVRGILGDQDFWEFVCECANRDCVESVQLSLDEYRTARSQPTWFVIRPGHVFGELEKVVHEDDRHAIVEKQGIAAEIAERGA